MKRLRLHREQQIAERKILGTRDYSIRYGTAIIHFRKPPFPANICELLGRQKASEHSQIYTGLEKHLLIAATDKLKITPQFQAKWYIQRMTCQQLPTYHTEVVIIHDTCHVNAAN